MRRGAAVLLDLLNVFPPAGTRAPMIRVECLRGVWSIFPCAVGDLQCCWANSHKKGAFAAVEWRIVREFPDNGMGFPPIFIGLTYLLTRQGGESFSHSDVIVFCVLLYPGFPFLLNIHELKRGGICFPGMNHKEDWIQLGCCLNEVVNKGSKISFL